MYSKEENGACERGRNYMGNQFLLKKVIYDQEIWMGFQKLVSYQVLLVMGYFLIPLWGKFGQEKIVQLF